MALMTGNEYVESLRALNLRVYMFGKKVENPVDMRFPFRRILKDWCPFVYKGIECAATSDLETCPHTLKGCRERNNSKRFGGEYSISTGGIYVSNK